MLPNSHYLPIDFARHFSERERDFAVNPQWPSNDGIAGRFSLLLQAFQRAKAITATDAYVLIEAERGTGKKLLAHFMHNASARSLRPFATITVRNKIHEYRLPPRRLV